MREREDTEMSKEEEEPKSTELKAQRMKREEGRLGIRMKRNSIKRTGEIKILNF